MRKTTVAAIQMGCGSDVKENIEKASELIREAAAQGAQVILPPELFERPYFCQERRYEYYGYARTPEEDDAVIHMKKLAKEHIFRTTIIIRKNFILRPVIQGFGHLKPDMGRLGLESAGISGFRRRQEAWH